MIGLDYYYYYCKSDENCVTQVNITTQLNGMNENNTVKDVDVDRRNIKR